MGEERLTVRKRTIRRQQRRVRLNELTTDIETIERHIARARTPQTVILLEYLRGQLYAAYITVVDSEV